MLQLSVRLSSSNQEKCWRGFRLQPISIQKKVSQRAVVQHVDSRQGENRKMASSFTLLKQITRLKNANSEIKSRIHSPT